MPEHLVGVLHALPQVALEHAVLHHVAGKVVARRRDVVVRATLTQVHLEHLIAAIAVVALDVEVGEAREADLLEEILDKLLQLGIGLRDDRARIAERSGRVLFEALATEAITLSPCNCGRNRP